MSLEVRYTARVGRNKKHNKREAGKEREGRGSCPYERLPFALHLGEWGGLVGWLIQVRPIE